MLNRLLITALTTTATLALVTGVASAKEVQGVTVCGATDCVSAGGDELGPPLVEGSSTANPPERGEAWYRTTIEIGAPGGYSEDFKIAVLPRSGLIRSRDQYGGFSWTSMDPSGQVLYRRLTRGLDAFPPGLLAGVEKTNFAPATPASDPAPAAPDDGGGSAAVPLLIAIGALAALAAAVLVRRTRVRSRLASP